jgi:hypothetical protein
MSERCPDCGGRMLDASGPNPFCSYKKTSGYGPCGVPRTPLTLVEAAAALRTAAFGDRDGHYIMVPLRDMRGSRARYWDDFTAALERVR